MSNLPEDIDHFVKENLEKIDVKFNPLHWDKLQKSLLSATSGNDHTSVEDSTSVIKKAIKFKKVLFISIASVLVIAVVSFYFLNKKQLNKPTKEIIKTDSIKKKHRESDTLKTVVNEEPTLISIQDSVIIKKVVKTDSVKRGTPVFRLSEDNTINSLKKDSVFLNDTVQGKKKKIIDPFW